MSEVQRLEDDGYVVILKWDGERSTGKKTILISKPGTDVFVRRDSDDMWHSLESALEEVQGIGTHGNQQAEDAADQLPARSDSKSK